MQYSKIHSKSFSTVMGSAIGTSRNNQILSRAGQWWKVCTSSHILTWPAIASPLFRPSLLRVTEKHLICSLGWHISWDRCLTSEIYRYISHQRKYSDHHRRRQLSASFDRFLIPIIDLLAVSCFSTFLYITRLSMHLQFNRNNVQMDAILTSDVIGTFKPNPSVYQTALRALQCEGMPSQVAMVAAHAYDLEAAAKLCAFTPARSPFLRWCCSLYTILPLCGIWRGFKTIYIVRHTEDVGLDPALLDKFDLVIREGGIGELARRLGAVWFILYELLRGRSFLIPYYFSLSNIRIWVIWAMWGGPLFWHAQPNATAWLFLVVVRNLQTWYRHNATPLPSRRSEKVAGGQCRWGHNTLAPHKYNSIDHT